ncbi:hypothetical protein BJP40_09840 [Streptomyces sp. CC53]|uniref:DUF4349 domain-containing protein n=1 Tax=unclassified Streptomyces TaxID=2593676 RepID=UPI0008DCA642|nr:MULTISPECIES: DUF4349 domain-containing protein [unclassified Streptomyces]OII60558.1 hypothetical protein BJP40_09840 [Streptomyces sp. CC53]
MPTRSRHAFAAVLLGASLALAGCGSGADGATSTADHGAAAPPAEGNAAEAPGYAGSAAAPGDRAPGQPAGEGAAQPGGRVPAGRQHVIRTAEMHIEVEDVEKALARARTVAVDAGGHVADESTERHARGDGRGGISSRVTLRVPQRAYDAAMKELSGAGKLLSRTAGAKDVTDQVVDVESRIATQRASVERVRKLMDEATQLSDVVTLEGELSRRQAELESLLARQAALKDSTSLATITLELSERGAARHEDGDDKPGFLDALRGGWGALVASAAWVLIVLAALAPWLAVAAVAYALWRLLVRPWRARRRDADVRAAVPSGASGLPVHPAPAGAAADPRPAQGPHGPQAQHVPATDRQTQAVPTPQSSQTPHASQPSPAPTTAGAPQVSQPAPSPDTTRAGEAVDAGESRAAGGSPRPAEPDADGGGRG